MFFVIAQPQPQITLEQALRQVPPYQVLRITQNVVQRRYKALRVELDRSPSPASLKEGTPENSAVIQKFKDLKILEELYEYLFHCIQQMDLWEPVGEHIRFLHTSISCPAMWMRMVHQYVKVVVLRRPREAIVH